MKRIIILTLVAALMAGLFSSLTLAANRVTVWKVDGELVETSQLARAYTGGSHSQECNNTQTINWETKAEVAQWLDLFVNGTQWRWYVRKPGTYFADCIGGQIRSNGDVTIQFEGFGPLLASDAETAVNPEIATRYGFDLGSGQGPLSEIDDWSGWYAAQLPNINIPDSELLHGDGQNFKLWNMIEVVPCNSAKVPFYSNSGTITVTLASQKPWIVGGEFANQYNF
ncbi:MAG TPA: hypothetical protein GX528_09730 [Firmicutes bacterium]|nr:hypothetical protein [Bacillota bacterium]